MPMGYSFKIPEGKEDKYAKAQGLYLPISTKHSVEICRELRGMKLLDAMKYLEEVIQGKRAVPFRRYNSLPHRSELTKIKTGRYPKKASMYILKVLKNVLNNAKQKGLDENRLRIVHIAAHKGPRITTRVKPIFHLYTRPMRKKITHIEVVVKEE